MNSLIIADLNTVPLSAVFSCHCHSEQTLGSLARVSEANAKFSGGLNYAALGFSVTSQSGEGREQGLPRLLAPSGDYQQR